MEPTVRELLAQIADPSRPVEPMLTSPAWSSIQSRVKELSLDDSLAMINAAGGPLQLDGGGTFDPYRHMILFAVGANPVPECSEALRAIADDVPPTAQAQLVRSLLEVGVRSSHPASIEAGLDVLDRYAEAGLELTALDTPLYWIVRQPSFPEVVEPRLRRLATHEQLARAIEEVRTAYRAAGLLEDGSGEPSLFTVDYLRRLADRDPAELVFLTDEQVSARVGDEWSRVYEVVTSMPTILLTAWAAWGVETEVSNGGLNQYFWNSAGQFAVEAVAALRTIGISDHADIIGAAIATFIENEPELRPFRQDGSLDAFSASYELETFEDLDQRFMAIQEQQSILDGLAVYLASHLDELAEALSAT